MTVASSTNDPACAGVDDGEITVGVTGGSGNYSYAWTPNVGTTPTVSNLSDGAYSVVITDLTAGCDTTINFTLNYTTNINVNVNTTDASCNGLTDGSLVALASGGTNYTYQWVGGPTTDTYTGVGAGSYTIEVTDISGCTGQASGTVTEPAADQASFASSSAFLDVVFTNTSTAGTYLWDFGDGNTSSATSPAHSYALPGTYLVCLSVTSNCGTDQACTDLTVDQDASAINETFLDYVNVYPNPASEFVNFQITSTNLKLIEIIDVAGRLIANATVKDEVTQFDISAFRDGPYFYRVLDASGNVVIVNKLMIVK